MENVIGSYLPYVTDLEQQAEDFNPLVAIREFVAWTQLLYNEVFNNLNPDGEADVLVAVDGSHRVLDYFLVRSSRDVGDDEVSPNQILMGTKDVTPEEWIASLIPIIHSVEGMASWYWIHKHPDGLPMVSEKDEYFASLALVQDFLQFGHPGSCKQFQQMLVVTSSSAIQVEQRFSGINPELDTATCRKFVDAYEVALGEDHPLTVAERNRWEVLKERADAGTPPNPILDMIWAMEKLLPVERALQEAKSEFDMTEVEIALDVSAWEQGFWTVDTVTGDHIRIDGAHIEMDMRSKTARLASESEAVREGTRHLHEEWLAARERPDAAFRMPRPVENAPVQQPRPEAPVSLSPTLLADLSGFDFSALD